MQFFQEKLHFKYQALVVLKSLVLLMGRLVACSVRIAADKQTDRQTDTHNNYCNPRMHAEG